MNEFAGNLSTLLFGVVGGAIGFIVIGFIILVLFLPIVVWLRRSELQHSGLERFAASLDTPDEGFDDLLPEARTEVRGTGVVPDQDIARPAQRHIDVPRSDDSFSKGGRNEPLTTR
jgi:hypothetical protein